MTQIETNCEKASMPVRQKQKIYLSQHHHLVAFLLFIVIFRQYAFHA